ncbi:aspartate/glutamate racemase family protein [Paenibacillus harenae]|uniref:Aspartate racemase n=1 Tax=Paenibacillus harenae TaxID=306543 RepID=A0ABT9UBD2_PAEHA|nr:amino acid racemase [Paenibacillus harenae]MDQ0063902.1 aspartate racemase [Paenibacillus harenae]MDQ0116318.1 aspartate racemase [Paenibacillus harenae]
MEHNSLGVIGGMGPKATSVFFDKVIEHTAAERDQEHINMIILNHTSLPDRTSVILGGRGELFLEAIAKDLKLLELAGVSNIAIPCNTSHYFYDEMQQMTSVPIINMVDETLKDIHAKFGDNSKIGILATTGTINSGVYKTVCESYNMKLHEPNEATQELVMDIIYNQVKSNLEVDPAVLEGIINDLVYKEGCNCVIIACTELSCIPISRQAMEISIDAMQVLVNQSIVRSGKQTITEI